VAVDAAGHPIVAWHDNTAGNYRIYLRRWNGSMWEELGGSATAHGISETRGAAARASLALDRLGHPVVAWDDNQTGNYEIKLKRWTGARWTEWEGSSGLGGLSDTPGYSSYPSLALDADGNPVVAWQDKSSGTFEIMLRRWHASPARSRR
jgi:hypothetical protein